MKINGNVEAASSRNARRRLEHEAEGGASGALAGAIVGASAGPPGAIAGAIMGGIAGALAGAVLDQESSAKEQRIRELDEEIGASAGGVPADGVTFSVRYLTGAKITGRFRTWRGSLLFDEKAPQNSRVLMEIDVASIDTNEPLRDAHLRSADFFDVETHPKVLFRSTKVERAGDKFKVTGDLTMHGITKPVALDVQYADPAKRSPMGPQAGFSVRGALDRKDWGLSSNRTRGVGELAIADEVEIDLGIAATEG